MDYARIYREFIADRLQKQPEAPDYFERHHILPRALGGGDEHENLIRLAPEDHIFAHVLLAKWLNDRGSWAAVKFIFGNACKNLRAPSRREIRLAAKAREGFAARNSGAGNPNFGKPMTQEQKERLRKANLGRSLPQQQRQKISKSLEGNQLARGFKHSVETRRKVALAATGRKHTEEAKERIRSALVGRELTDEHKASISAAKKGMDASHLHTPEARAKRGAALRGRVVSEETRAKQSAARKGRLHSDDTRLMLSEMRRGQGNSRARRVACVTTGEIFGCIKDAAEKFGIPQPTLRAALNRSGGGAVTHGLEFRKM